VPPVFPGFDALTTKRVCSGLDRSFHSYSQAATVAARPLGWPPGNWLVVGDHQGSAEDNEVGEWRTLALGLGLEQICAETPQRYRQKGVRRRNGSSP